MLVFLSVCLTQSRSYERIYANFIWFPQIYTLRSYLNVSENSKTQMFLCRVNIEGKMIFMTLSHYLIDSSAQKST